MAEEKYIWYSLYIFCLYFSKKMPSCFILHLVSIIYVGTPAHITYLCSTSSHAFHLIIFQIWKLLEEIIIICDTCILLQTSALILANLSPCVLHISLLFLLETSHWQLSSLTRLIIIFLSPVWFPLTYKYTHVPHAFKFNACK